MALHLKCQYQLLIVQRRLLRKNQGEVTQTLLLFGWKKLLVKVYHHHKPVDHRSLTVLIILPLLLHSWSLCICKWRGSYSLFPCFFLCPETPNELLRYSTTTRSATKRLRTPTNTSESTRID